MPKGVFLFSNAERDVRILEGLAAGLNNVEIAKRMGLTHGTVRVYVTMLIEKLGATSRTHAVMRGIAEGMIAAPAVAPKPTRPKPRGRQLTIEATKRK